MVTLSTKLKNIAFLIIGTFAIGFIALNYAKLGGLVGLKGYYVVSVELPQTGGLTTHADVTLRGTSVGRVGPLKLTDDGVIAELQIDHDAPNIPRQTQAVVANRSAVGEQYIDLRPSSDAGPYLAAGSRIPRSATATPAPVTDLLTSVNALAASVPLESLRVVVDEFGTAFNGQGQNLQALMDSGRQFTKHANENIEPTSRLIQDTQTVLRTQNDNAGAIVQFGRDARLLAQQLRTSDPDLRRLIAAGPGASREMERLLDDLDPSFSVLLANMTTTSDVLKTRAPALEELLSKLPGVVGAASSVIQDGKLQFGMTTTFFNPRPCTAGYGGTQNRNGLDTSPGKPFNTDARCASPPSSGINVRGSGNAPGGGALPPPRRAGSLGVSGAGALPGALGTPPLPPSTGTLLQPGTGR
ncbi:MCE family protein [Actinomadura flavalba]|uniref:MCE family protein n=1 Tax=Actinomadura flavalba TaxID=1120938 RepID=UPI000377A24B|nr:MlaD family protein [Actinomadura flavalba]